MEPERHRLDGGASERRVDLDRQQVGDLPLSLRNAEPVPRAALRRPRRLHADTSRRRVPSRFLDLPAPCTDTNASLARPEQHPETAERLRGASTIGKDNPGRRIKLD
jgi:hypothetical protein